jgi:hypothetical protein
MRTMGLLLSTEACQQEKLRSKTSLPMAQCERPAGTARCSRGFSRMLKSQVCGRVLPHYARPETALLVTEVCDTVTRRHYPSPPPPPLPSLCRDFDRWVIHTVASVKIAAEERTCFWRRPGRQGLGLCRARCRRPSMGSTRRPHQAGAWHAQVHAHEHVARTDVTTA